jgi:protein-tyrosine kinase
MSRLKKAMQRAQLLRKEADRGLDPLRPALKPTPEKKIPEPKQKEIKVNYSKTRVERIDKELLRKNKLFSLFKEQRTTDEIERLRTQVLAQLKESGGNTLMVTSAHPGEGKTFTSINLGISIAKQLDKTVLLVDCDLRNPWRHHFDFATDFFGLTVREGLADYLIKGVKLESILINPGIEKLTLLPGGRPVPNSSELLGSKKMETLINDLKERYREDRIVIFDCPAMLACSDPLVFSHLIDGIILVVEAERTNPEELKRVIELLKDKPVLGTILNKSKDQKESYI